VRHRKGDLGHGEEQAQAVDRVDADEIRLVVDPFAGRDETRSEHPIEGGADLRPLELDAREVAPRLGDLEAGEGVVVLGLRERPPLDELLGALVLVPREDQLRLRLAQAGALLVVLETEEKGALADAVALGELDRGDDAVDLGTHRHRLLGLQLSDEADDVADRPALYGGDLDGHRRRPLRLRGVRGRAAGQRGEQRNEENRTREVLHESSVARRRIRERRRRARTCR
jgi:hypothetical protein